MVLERTQRGQPVSAAASGKKTVFALWGRFQGWSLQIIEKQQQHLVYCICETMYEFDEWMRFGADNFRKEKLGMVVECCETCNPFREFGQESNAVTSRLLAIDASSASKIVRDLRRSQWCLF